MLDVDAMRAASTFPIAPDDLIFRCQEVLAANVGTKDPDMLADEFEFAGPVVGPINKEQYLKAVDAALDNIYAAFPELKAQYYVRCCWLSIHRPLACAAPAALIFATDPEVRASIPA